MGFARIQSLTGLTDEQARAGALFLTGHALDLKDARELLEKCGLIPYESGQPPKPDAGKAPVIKYNRPGQR